MSLPILNGEADFCRVDLGAAGIGIWVDPKHLIVGIYLSTIRTYDADTDEYDWDFDLFQNMVSAAIIP